MKRLFVCFVTLVLFFSLAACSKTGTAGKRSAANVDWKQIYLKELLAAQEYAAATDWENYDQNSKYPIELYAAQIIDLNFDGIPELLLFGPGASASQNMRIFTINGKNVQMIFNDWGNIDSITLYNKTGSDSQAFGFESANGNVEQYGGAFYLTTANTKMDKSFAKAAKFAEFSEKHDYDYNEETNDIIDLGSTYTFKGRKVSQSDYSRLMSNVFSEYEELPYRSIGMTWNSGWYEDTYSITLLTENQIMPFLDSFEPEDGIGDLEYRPEDAASESEYLISYLLHNVDKAAEFVYGRGMTILVTEETVELDGDICRIIVLGTNHYENFVREIYYAITSTDWNIYEYDPIEDVWYLMYVFGAVG